MGFLWIFGMIILFISLIFFKVKHEINYERIRTLLFLLIMSWPICFIAVCIIFLGTILYDGLIKIFVKILKKDPKKFKSSTKGAIEVYIDFLHNR
jgi:FtsH-binding integral membrane protein